MSTTIPTLRNRRTAEAFSGMLSSTSQMSPHSSEAASTTCSGGTERGPCPTISKRQRLFGRGPVTQLGSTSRKPSVQPSVPQRRPAKSSVMVVTRP